MSRVGGISETAGRIGVLHVRDSSGMYGAERVILALGKHLDRGKFDFELLCLDRRDGRSRLLVDKARSLRIRVSTVAVTGRLHPAAILRLRRRIRDSRARIVHTHDFKSDAYVAIATAFMNIKRVSTAHGSTRDSLRKRVYLFLNERVVYRFFHKIVSVSRQLSLQLQRHGVKEGSIAVISNGLDGDGLEMEAAAVADISLRFNEGVRVFSVVGRLFPDKGHRFFLEAFARIGSRRDQVGALIVGEGPSLAEIREHVIRLNLQDRVRICGFRSDMRSVYRNTDFLVIPSLTEGLPYVMLEAMSLRIPVLATAVGDIPAAITDGVSGLLVPPGNVDALEAGMEALLDDRTKADQMAERGREVVQQRFSAERMALETGNLYKFLVA